MLSVDLLYRSFVLFKFDEIYYYYIAMGYFLVFPPQ
jgi:hypothetical protein